MKWSNAERIFSEEPWLRYAIGNQGLEDIEDETRRERERRKWAERYVKRIAFHPFEALDPKWATRSTASTIETTDDWSDAINRGVKQWMDTVSSFIRFHIIYFLDNEESPRAWYVDDRKEWDESKKQSVAKNNLVTAMNELVNHFGEKNQREWGNPGRRVRIHMVMRHVRVSSDKYDTLYACYDLYRIPKGFRLTQNGWTTLQMV